MNRMTLPFLVVTAVLLLALPTVLAQEPSPTPEAASTASAYLRVWSMLPAEVPAPIVGDAPSLAEELDLVYMDEAGAPQFLARHLRPFSTNGYAEQEPATRKILLVRKTGSSFQELAKLDAVLKANTFFTVVVQKENGRYFLALIDDTLKPPKQEPGQPPPPPPKQIVLHDFLPGDAITVSSKAAGFSQTVSFGAPQIITGLPEKIFDIQVPLKIKNREFLNNIEIDLKENDSLSVLIVQNLYGRPAVTVIPNGKLE